MNRWLTDGSRWPLIVAIAVAYVVAAKVGFTLAFATRQVTAVWPPTGIAVAGLLLGGARCWPGVFAGAFVANAMASESLLTAAAIAVGNTLGPLLSAYLLQQVVGFDSRLERARDVILLALFGAAAAMCVTATNGVVQLFLAGLIPVAAMPSVWWIWWAGDAMGVLLITPLILTCLGQSAAGRAGGRSVELLLLALVLVSVSWISFSRALPLAYPVFPVVIWSAMRFGQRETAAAAVAISGIALWATVHDQGPFVEGTLDQRLAMLVTFMASVSVTALLLGAVTAERRVAEDGLRSAHAELEQRVEQRTQELSVANAQLVKTNEALNRRTAELASKNEEVEAFVYIVSHDLRAPLVNLQGYAQELRLSCGDLSRTLKEAALPEALLAKVEDLMSEGIATSLRYIGASVDKFERLIGALLTVSRTGQQKYRIERLNIANIVQATLDSQQQLISSAGAVIEQGALPDAYGDATAVGQVFGNLIGNALKYRVPDKACHVEIGGVAEGGHSHYWVRDNGPGIPATAQRRLFQVFQRFHPHLASGEGIGLAAVKRIVERHGGRIWVESQTGIGSQFHFLLPGQAPEVAT